MKSLTYLLIGLSALFLFSSCDHDIGGCTVWASDNYNPSADYDDGSCNLWRDKFLSSYEAVEQCYNFYEYPISITQGIGDFDEVIINNFGDFGINVNAYVQGNGIFIDNQKFILSNGEILEIWNAVGKYEHPSVIINYEFNLGGYPDICSIRASKF